MNDLAPALLEPCVWMTAGLVSYKLCDRAYECTHCPLDAALHGGGPPAGDDTSPSGESRRGHGFPDDRRYGTGHTWIQAGHRRGEPTVRIGVDGFAAGLMPRPVGATAAGAPRDVERGSIICRIEFRDGQLAVRTPVEGRSARENPALRDHPELIVESPYRDGWLVDLLPARIDGTPGELVDADQARAHATLHLRHFRRRVALHLLTDTMAAGPCLADGGEPLTSLVDILGGRQYLQILAEILR